MNILMNNAMTSRKKKPNKELHNFASNRNLQAPDNIDLKKRQDIHMKMSHDHVKSTATNNL